jgi:cytochrome c biogenesis protein CcdA/DsbC/DsbD-like thiol-disulfide interchange protein
MSRLRLLLVAVVGVVLTVPALAQGQVKGSLFTRTRGDVVRAAIELSVKDGWHIYHRELGHESAVGLPTTVTLGGAGITWGDVSWPEPIRIDQEEFGAGVFILAHEGRVVLTANGKLADGAGGADASAKIKGQACQQACVMVALDLQSSGAGPDEYFSGFVGEPAPAAPDVALGSSPGAGEATAGGGEAQAAPPPPTADQEPPTEDHRESGRADATLYVRVDGTTVRAAIEIAIEPGWHLYHLDKGTSDYAESLRVTLHGSGITWGAVSAPDPERVDVGELEPGKYVLQHGGTIVLAVEGTLAADASGDDVWAELRGQTCSDQHCITYKEVVSSRGRGPEGLFGGEAVAGGGDPDGAGGASGTTDGADGASDTGAADSRGLLVFLLEAVGWALFTLLMPCTYPMIPITISFFTKQADKRGGNVTSLALLYGLGIVLVFVVIGIVFGSVIIPFATNPWTNLLIGLAFLFFALTLFGVVNLQPPRALLNVAGQASMTGGYLGVFLMGTTLVVTSFTCTAPFVGTLLARGASGGDLGRIALGMAVFGLTMAIPFVALSLVPGKVKALPKSGEWMNTLKVTLGFVEVAAALKFLSNADLVWGWRILSRELFLIAWCALFVLAALYLFGAFRRERFLRVGLGQALSGAVVLAFALYNAWGVTNPLDRVMNSIAPNYSGGRVTPEWYLRRDSWTMVVDDFDTALRVARDESKLLLVNFTGHT